jgi:hypothetical protein
MRGAGVVVLVWCAACYAPTPQPGAPCANGVCPSGLICVASTQRCELEEPPSDAAIEHGDNDAADAAVVTDDAGNTLTCYGDGIVSICPNAPITMPLAINSNTTIDTETSPLCIAYTGGSENAYCVIAATTISIAQNRRLRAQGTRPLVLLATSAITIDGTIDVSAGAATNPFVCAAPVAAVNKEGGAGGSFHGRGGSGGAAVSGLGPASGAVATSVAFRGGCDGGRGAGGSGGAGGNGGGAMYLIASSIEISGVLNASGSGGGAGGSGSGGGGGGGAGGFIGLDAPAITVTGRVFANGGGGGEGGTQYRGGNGGASPNNESAASGGSGGAPHGGNGGAGSAGTSLNGVNGEAGGSCGRGSSTGGGGGGGAGMIYVFPAQTLGGSISPPV